MTRPNRRPAPPQPEMRSSVRPLPDRVLALGESAVERFCEVAGACLSDGVRPELADQIGYQQVRAWLRDCAIQGGENV